MACTTCTKEKVLCALQQLIMKDFYQTDKIEYLYVAFKRVAEFVECYVSDNDADNQKVSFTLRSNGDISWSLTQRNASTQTGVIQLSSIIASLGYIVSVADTSSIDLAVSGAGQLTATVLPAGVDHNLLLNYVTNEHIDHSSVSIIAGTGLTGGGDLTASRTLDLADTTVTPGTFGDSTNVGQFIVDQQGRLTFAGNVPIAFPTPYITTNTDTADIDITVAAGDISALLTATGVVAGTYGSATQPVTISVDSKGRITSITNNTASIATITDTNSIDLTITANSLSADLRLSATAAPAGSKIVTNVIDSGGLYSYFPIANLSGTAPIALSASGVGVLVGSTNIALSLNVANTSDINLTAGANLTADLTTTGVVAGSYGGATTPVTIVVDNKGRVTSLTTGTAIVYEVPLTFSTGLTRTVNTITANISTGISGGQSIYGGTAASENLTIFSTVHGTKGDILFGTSAYKEATNRLGVGLTGPNNTIQVLDLINFNNTLTGTFLGYQASNALSTGTNNTHIGYQAGKAVSSGSNHTIIGYLAGTTISVNNRIVAIGAEAMRNATGGDNVGIGYQALKAATGSNNVAIGFTAMSNHLGGEENVAVGNVALGASTTGNWNTGIGFKALSSITTGGRSTGVGSNCLRLDTSGGNAAVGAYAGELNSTGYYNSILGDGAFRYNTTGIENIAVGHHAALGASGLIAVTGNTVVGTWAGELMATGADYNILVGWSAAHDLTTGSKNIAIGYNVGLASNTGTQQLVIGNLIYGTGLDGTTTTLSTGKIGIGIKAPDAKFHILSTTEQLRVGYDASNYYSATVSSAGVVTFNAVGASSSFVFSDQIKVDSGINNNGAGYKHVRQTTGSISGSSSALVTVTWATTFADANYTVAASVEDSTSSSLSLFVIHIESKSASQVVVRVRNDSVGSLTGTLSVIAVHD